jgi:RNA polymerase sigma-70 factor (ECF subfamily)
MTETLPTEAQFRQAALDCLDGLYGYAVSLSRNRSEAEDLVQETYLRAMRAFGQLAAVRNLKSWLYAIARNIWLNQQRHTHSGPPFVEMDEEQNQNGLSRALVGDDPYMSYVGKVERESVRAAVQQLPALYREVILLREFERLSYNEIADILHCPAGTVMSRLGRARDKLRLLLTNRSVRPHFGK